MFIIQVLEIPRFGRWKVATFSRLNRKSPVQKTKGHRMGFAPVHPQSLPFRGVLNRIFPDSESLGPRVSGELSALARERNPEMFFEQLLACGQRLSAAGDSAAAARIYETLSAFDASLPASPSPSIRTRAQEALLALRGQASFGRHAETLVGHFLATATDYRTILPMMAGTAVFQVTRAAAWRSLLNAPRAWWSSGFGARAVSALLGTALEIPTFTLLGRGLRQAAGEPSGDFVRELAEASLTLGALKFAGWASGSLASPLQGKPLARSFVQQAGSFAGMVGAHQLSSHLGLRPDSANGNLIADTLASLLALQVGARLGQSVAGASWAQWQMETSVRAASQGPNRPTFSFPLTPAMEGTASANKILSTRLGTPRPPVFLAVGNGESGGGGRLTPLEEATKLLNLENNTLQTRRENAKDLQAAFEKLGPDDRRTLAEKVAAQIGRPYHEEQSLINMALLVDLMPGLPAAERLPLALKMTANLKANGNYNQSRVTDALGNASKLLDPEDRFTLALAVESGLDHKEFSVRCAARWALNRLTTHLDAAQNLKLAERLRARMENADPAARRIAADALGSVISELEAQRRKEFMRPLEAALNDEDYLVRRSAVEGIKDALRHLPEAERLDPVLAVVTRLAGHHEKEWEFLSQKIVDTFSRLSIGDRRRLADLLQENTGIGDWHARRQAIHLLQPLLPLLPGESARVAALANKIDDEHEFVRAAAVTAMGPLNKLLPADQRLANALRVEAKGAEDFKYLKYAADSALQYMISSFTERDRLGFIERMGERLKHENAELRDIAVKLTTITARDLKPRNLLPPVLLLEAVGEDPDKKVAESARGALKELIPLLNASRRIKMLEKVLEREGLAGVSLGLLPALFNRIPSAALLAHARATQNAGLAQVAAYHEAGLPLLPQVWEAYLDAEDPAGFLRIVSGRIQQHRRGERIPLHHEWERALAYGGLDGPEQLSFAEFSQGLDATMPPPPFLNRAFEALIPERLSVHRLVDKGKIREALLPIADVKNGGNFDNYLWKLTRQTPPSLLPFQPGLKHLYEKIKLSYPAELPAEAIKLIRELWPQRETPAVQELIVRLVVLIAWHRDAAASLKPKIELMTGKRIPSESLRDVVLATEEFFQDTVGDVLRDENLDAKLLPWLVRTREHLATERERMRGTAGHAKLVEFLPSSTQADKYFGYVAEDCTKGKTDAIARKDFQIYRMVAEGRLVGVAYVQKIKTGWFKKSLVVALQPRSFWEVDQDFLLQTMEANFARLAKAEGYDKVLMMNDGNQQSNRQDMLAAIAGRGYPEFSLRKGIFGAVFHGKHFLILWERGKPLPEEPTYVPPPPLLAPAEPGELLSEEEDADALPETLPPPPAVEAIDVLPETSEVLDTRPVQVQLATRGENEASWESFQRLLYRMQAEANNRLSVRQRRKIQRAMEGRFMEEMRRAFEEAGVPAVGIGFPDSGRGRGGASNLPVRVPPAPLVRYGMLARPPKMELVAPGTLILKFKSLEAILSDPAVTRTDKGWFEPSLRGKLRTVTAGEVVGGERPGEYALARGDEVSPQELFDFYNVVFHQGFQFKAYLRLLQNRGADIQELAPQVEAMSLKLDEALQHLLAQRFSECLAALQEVDTHVTRFQEIMIRIAKSVGLEIHPVTGMLIPR